MSNVYGLVLLLLSIPLLVLYVVTLIRVRRGSVEMLANWGLDAVSFFIMIVGGVALGQLLASGMSPEPLTLAVDILGGIILILSLVLLLILPRRALIRIIKPGGIVDERVVAISAKSARNALLITYLALVAFIIKNEHMLDRNSLIIVVAGGLLAFYASYFFYYYRKS